MLEQDSKLALHQHRAFESPDLNQFRDYLSGAYCDHRVYRRGSASAVYACHNRVQLRSMSLNYLTYGAEVEIDPGAFNLFYMLELPLTGSTELEYRGDTLKNTMGSAILISPDEPVRSQWSEDCGQQMIKISRQAVEQYAADMLGHAIREPLVFEPFLDLTSTPGKDIHQLCSFLYGLHAGVSGLLGERRVSGELERSLVSALLVGQPSNYTEAFQLSACPVTPRHVKRALVYIDEHLREEIDMKALAEVAGASTRALYTGFERFVGMPPQAYIRNKRLEGAKVDLERLQAPVTVASVAMEWCFTHLGRFSIEYRNRFGESPSDTLRR